MKRLLKSVMLLTLIIGLFAGCNTSKEDKFISEEINPNINVFGIKLLMEEKEVIYILGGEGEYSPCVYGYERTYDDKHLSIGFDKDSKVRKIIVKSSNEDVYGIKKGMDEDEALNILKENSFTKEEDTSRSVKDKIFIKILGDDNNKVKGSIIEIIPE
ncbi:hypothetical protein [Anaeromicrobium sediminis]|uniref:Lipoprotein n=1 Tax=Anaeromicrobium sediminis TaxID=1478221 RepID=A0A267MCX3_9FIRM|nr:hypothetical protein [Anaeromicrobium sediminis]PAB57406.1 hypothetical protein CCE28_19110 [Anaeromicrobium sediminis]